MTNDELWDAGYMRLLNFMQSHARRPSKHHPEEHAMLNWLKSQRRRYRLGLMPAERVDRFRHLLQTCQQLQRVNQYAYVVETESNQPPITPQE